MKPKLHKEFDEFHNEIALTNHNDLKDKKEILQSDLEKNFPEKLKEKEIADIKKSDLKFIDQGSWAPKVKTSIKPKKNGEEGDKTFDRDVAMIFPLDIYENNDPRKLKRIVKDILTIEDKRIPKIKEPCVTVHYSKEGDEIYHLDFPLYAKDALGNLYLARGKETTENYDWEPSDPEGLNAHFVDHFADEEGDQKRRIVRYIKQWKQEKYSNPVSGNQTPPSIGLTLLACDNFYCSYDSEYFNDLEALHYTLQNILSQFSIVKNWDGEITSADITCNLPTVPGTDVFYKMRNPKEHMVTFYKRFKTFVDNIENAYNAEHAHEAARYVVKSLGDKFEIPPKEAKSDTSNLKKEDRFA